MLSNINIDLWLSIGSQAGIGKFDGLKSSGKNQNAYKLKSIEIYDILFTST